MALRYFNAAGCDFDCEIGEIIEVKKEKRKENKKSEQNNKKAK